MENLVLFLITFFITLIVRFIAYLYTKKKKNKNRSLFLEIKYLENRFKLNYKRLNNKWFALLLSVIDGLIVGTTLIIIVLISDNLILELTLGLIISFIMIFVVYEVLGRVLLWKGFDKK